jgi:hypothetical protein
MARVDAHVHELHARVVEVERFVEGICVVEQVPQSGFELAATARHCLHTRNSYLLAMKTRMFTSTTL